jgi:hypothetical protein
MNAQMHVHLHATTPWQAISLSLIISARYPRFADQLAQCELAI